MHRCSATSSKTARLGAFVIRSLSSVVGQNGLLLLVCRRQTEGELELYKRTLDRCIVYIVHHLPETHPSNTSNHSFITMLKQIPLCCVVCSNGGMSSLHFFPSDTEVARARISRHFIHLFFFLCSLFSFFPYSWTVCLFHFASYCPFSLSKLAPS